MQKFRDSKGSYLRLYRAEDASGTQKMAADIIYEAAQSYQVNPKYILATLQKEQSLITDDTPTQKQLDWATGYAVCDSCSMEDPKIAKFKGFGKQVDNAAGIIRWYYDNRDRSIVKKKDSPVRIDNQDVTPQSWATAFLYTYTPHLHGNRNFWRIWTTWFEQTYPNGTLVRSAEADEYWLIQDGTRRKFKNKSTLVTRIDPKLAIIVADVELSNYQLGAEISFPNYSLLQAPSGIYLVDYDTLRPFESEEVVRKIGYNPQEFLEIQDADIASFSLGPVITASTTAPQGVIYQITDLPNTYYLFKDNILTPLAEKRVVDTNFKGLRVEKHKLKELANLPVADLPIKFNDGILLQTKDSNMVYVLDKGKKRRIADDDTFRAMGYKRSNVITIDLASILNIPEGERLFLNSNLLSSKNKFLGDNAAPVSDLFKSKLPSYLVAEYPTGRIISGKNIDARRSIASLTKLVTAFEALAQDYNLTKSTVYNSKNHAIEKNSMDLRDGEKIRNLDLFNTMLIASNNSTARMVAQGTGLSEVEFVKKANQRLEEWGADDTYLTDVTGLDGGNKSTARDLLKIFTKVLTNKTIKDTLAKTEYSFRELVNKNKTALHTFKNSNKIIQKTGRNYRILASKTGYTEEADSILIMLVESRKIPKKQYIIITMGDPDYAKRFEEPNKIAQWIATGNVKIAAGK